MPAALPERGAESGSEDGHDDDNDPGHDLRGGRPVVEPQGEHDDDDDGDDAFGDADALRDEADAAHMNVPREGLERVQLFEFLRLVAGGRERVAVASNQELADSLRRNGSVTRCVCVVEGGGGGEGLRASLHGSGLGLPQPSSRGLCDPCVLWDAPRSPPPRPPT